MWHECGRQCTAMHEAFVQKILSIIKVARTPSDLRVSQSPGPGQEIDFDLLNETLVPPASNVNNWRDPLELFAILELAPAARTPNRLFVESSRGLQPVPADLAGIVLEHWSLRFEPRSPHEPVPSSAQHMELHARMLVRTIYSLTRLLPTGLQTSLIPPSESLSIGLREPSDLLHSPQVARRGLDESIAGESVGGAFEAASLVQLAPLLTPHGAFYLSVRYRRECKFIWEHEEGILREETRGTLGESMVLAAPAVTTINATTTIASKPTESTLDKEDDPSSFENVELEPVPPSPGISTHDPNTGRSGQGTGSSAPRAIRSKSLHNVTSPLATNAAASDGSRRTSSPNTGNIPAHSCSGSSLAEDSQLAQFIKEMDRRPTLVLTGTGSPPKLPNPATLREAYDRARIWIRAQIRNHETRSKLMFSPLMERHELPSDDNGTDVDVVKDRAGAAQGKGRGRERGKGGEKEWGDGGEPDKTRIENNNESSGEGNEKGTSNDSGMNGRNPSDDDDSRERNERLEQTKEEEPFIFDFAESK